MDVSTHIFLFKSCSFVEDNSSILNLWLLSLVVCLEKEELPRWKAFANVLLAKLLEATDVVGTLLLHGDELVVAVIVEKDLNSCWVFLEMAEDILLMWKPEKLLKDEGWELEADCCRLEEDSFDCKVSCVSAQGLQSREILLAVWGGTHKEDEAGQREGDDWWCFCLGCL